MLETAVDNLRKTVPVHLSFEPKRGKENAVDKGLKISTYKYVIICDDDNWLADEYVETAFNVMESNPSIGLLGGKGIAAIEGKIPDWFKIIDLLKQKKHVMSIIKWAYIAIVVIACGTSRALAIPSNYFEYFILINKAELKIVDSSYAEALIFYEQAFAKVKYTLAADMYNAAVCAYLVGNNERAINYARNCAVKGLDIRLFESCMFSEMHGNEKWIDLVKSREGLRDMHYQKIDLVLRRKIDLLVAKDQTIRFDNPNRNEAAKDAIAKIDHENFSELLALFQEHGIPGEEQIGSDDQMSPYFLILWHNYASFSENFIQQLKSAVLEGKFDRYDYTRIITLKTSLNTIYGSRAFIRVGTTLYVENYTKEQIQMIDANRMELGLESFDELKKKVLFGERDKRFMFGFGGVLGFNFANEKDKDKENFIKNLIPLN